MIQRTESEMKAYVDGYNACFNQFIEYFENPLYEFLSNMYVMKAAVNAVVECEEQEVEEGAEE